MRREAERHLDVFCGTRTVGRLSGTIRELSFRYFLDWINNGFPLSFGLPLREGAYGDEETRAYFGNLAPEERIMEMLAKAGKFPGRDLLSFFGIYGRECAGAISIGVPSPESRREREIGTELEDFFRENPGGSIQLALRTRISLGGAQDKLPCVFRNGRIFAVDGPTTHILKPDIPDYPHSSRNELFCLDLARDLDLPVPDAELLRFPNCEALIIERYDRENGERLHQQDFCQALGLLSDYKYQGQGVFFGFPDMLDVCRKNDIDAKHFLGKAQAFNWIIGNCDAHAKNFSLVLQDGSWQMAPLYDLLCTMVYPGLNKNMAMLFGKHIVRDEISVDDFEIAGDLLGINDYPDRVSKMAVRAMKRAPELVKEHKKKYGDCRIYEKILEAIAQCEAKINSRPKTRKKPSHGEHPRP